MNNQSIWIALAIALATPATATNATPDTGIVTGVMELNHSRDAFLRRLHHERRAADTYRTILSMNLESYAGAWFDPDHELLNVALSSSDDIKLIEVLDAKPHLVHWSLNELKNTHQALILSMRQSNIAFHTVSVDVEANAVTVDVPRTSFYRAKTLAERYGPDVNIRETDQKVEFTSLSLRGAIGTHNHSWDLQYGGLHPCSVGVATENGFLTAGHCGHQLDTIYRDNMPLGETIFSTLHSLVLPPHQGYDAGWVETLSGWDPTPEIHGYNSGIIPVPGKWSGVNEVPINSTVCRYGSTSGGPHCGQVTNKFVTKNLGTGLAPILIHDLTEVSGACVDDGDSGGPFISASDNQIQGITVGGSLPKGCPPTLGQLVWFQRIATVSDLAVTSLGYENAILTSHGASTPELSGLICPNPSGSGSGRYMCSFQHFVSQGSTSISWSSSTGDSSTGIILSGTCQPGSPVTTSLSVSNSYGTKNEVINFICPTTIIP